MHDSMIRDRSELDPSLRARLTALCDEGWEIWSRFDQDDGREEWHPFVPVEYDRVLQTLLSLRAPAQRFLEWGSATGVVAIMADMLGFEAYGIELDADLVEIARRLAEKYDSGARFAAGSFLPTGYRWMPPDGDGRLATIGHGPSAYPMLGLPLEEFDLVYGYPWSGEEPMMRDLMRCYGGRNARLILQGAGGSQVYTRKEL
jgi:SAM-dependent methyltransferase